VTREDPAVSHADDQTQTAPYDVEKRDSRYEIRASSGRTVMVFGDEGSARHYASLLNEAYRAGYRAATRQGRSPQEKPGLR
jgi:hypothetical protein